MDDAIDGTIEDGMNDEIVDAMDDAMDDRMDDARDEAMDTMWCVTYRQAECCGRPWKPDLATILTKPRQTLKPIVGQSDVTRSRSRFSHSITKLFASGLCVLNS